MAQWIMFVGISIHSMAQWNMFVCILYNRGVFCCVLYFKCLLLVFQYTVLHTESMVGVKGSSQCLSQALVLSQQSVHVSLPERGL